MSKVELSKESKAMRDALGEVLIEMGKDRDDLVVLDADVSSSTRTGRFAQHFPDRFINVGVAEANMADIAAGLACSGYRPVISTFALFLTLKAADQIRNVIAYNKLPVVIVGGYAGLSDSFDGASHQAISDIALMQAIPNMRVSVPADADDFAEALRDALEHDGPTYIRACRNPLPLIQGWDPYQRGRGRRLRRGDDCTLVASGVLCSKAMEAAEQLEAEGLSVDLLQIRDVKPLDNELLIESAQRTGAVVVAEEHNTIGGIGSAVAQTLGKHCPTSIDFIGVDDCFTESGPYEALLEKYGLSSSAMKNAVKKMIAQKRKNL